MSTQDQQEGLISAYLQAAGAQDGERYIISAEELAWLLGHTAQLSAASLRMLTALQHALPQTGPAQELKETLTNVIIMQTRLKEREESLANAVRDAAKSGAVHGVPIDVENIRELAKGILQASQHVQQKASRS